MSGAMTFEHTEREEEHNRVGGGELGKGVSEYTLDRVKAGLHASRTLALKTLVGHACGQVKRQGEGEEMC